jgi:hypothetical protein
MTGTQKNISVIVATFKRPFLLEQTLRSFLSLDTTRLDWEVLIVDNANDQETKKIVKNFSGQIPLKYFVELKRGKNNALNRAIPEAQGELFVFTDDDVIVEKNWLLEIWNGVRRWPDNHVFGGRCLPKYPEGEKMPFDHPFFEGAFSIADWDIPEGCYESHRVWGPNMAIRSSIFKNGWSFDPTLGPKGSKFCILGDETDLTGRLEEAGYLPVYLPAAVVYHQIQRERMNFKWMFRRAFSIGQQNARLDKRQDIPRILGAPRYMVRKLCRAFIDFHIRSLFSTNSRMRFERGLIYWETKGSLYYWFQKNVSGK